MSGRDPLVREWDGPAVLPPLTAVAGGLEARGAHRHVAEDGSWIGLYDRHRHRQKHAAFGWPRCQGSRSWRAKDVEDTGTFGTGAHGVVDVARRAPKIALLYGDFLPILNAHSRAFQ